MSSLTPDLLLYSDTRASADLLYLGRVEVHDAFIALRIRGRTLTVQSALELGRVRRTGRFDVVLARDACLERARRRHGPKAGVAEIIAVLAREHGVRRFRVPDDFPGALYRQLLRLGLKLDFAGGLLLPEREAKTPWEAQCIREGNRLCAVGFRAAESILRAARIRGRRLFHRGRPVTSESLRFAIDVAILEQGGNPQDTIVAGGDQACDPHERGSGPIRPHELVIIDVFPRVTKTGYHGDMTRTYLKGRAREVQRRLVATVREAQRRATREIRAGVAGRDVHAAVVACFADAGYETRHTSRGSVGFFHGTGHGLGLEVHDPGRISPTNAQALKLHSVLTVEPGLYYPGLGGCRWEDVVQVTATGSRPLSRHPYVWEFR